MIKTSSQNDKANTIIKIASDSVIVMIIIVYLALIRFT